MDPKPSSRRDAPLDQLSDEELACRTQAGSSACFGEVVRRHGDRLLRFLIHRTRSVQDAEDLLQDTFARAYQRIESYNPRWRLTTWLYTIAARQAYSLRRRPTVQTLLDPAQRPAGGQDPAASAARNEEKTNLWALAEDTLSGNQFSALWLRYGEEMSVREISRVMNKTQTHVKVLLFRGRSNLGRRLRTPEVPGRPVRAGAPGPTPCASAAEGGR